VVANDNAPGQVVLSGAKAADGPRARHRQGQGRQAHHSASVSAPFHCSLMQPAADVMADALAK